MTVRVCHIINGLDVGGAEMMLYKLLKSSTVEQLEASVISLLETGPIADLITSLDLPVTSLALARRSMIFGRGVPTPKTVWKLGRAIASARPDLLQGWMYHGNLAATLGAVISGRRYPVVWNVRHSVYDLGKEKSMTAKLIRLGRRLSSRPNAIIYNAKVSAEQHEALGYDPGKTVIIPNGFDCDHFKPDAAKRGKLRAELGLTEGTSIVGMVARDHPQKDSFNLLRAIALVIERGSPVHLAIAGASFDDHNRRVTGRIRELGIGDHVSLLGPRSDIADIMAGFDVVALPSAWGEGFPNVLGEAMACGVPCAATDVGDAAWIIDVHGRVVPPGDAQALAMAIDQLISLPREERRQIGMAARRRILDHFSLPKIVQAYGDLYERIVAEKPAIDKSRSTSEELPPKRAM